MIIEKEYDFERYDIKNDNNFLYSLRCHHNKIITDINRNWNIISKNDHTRCVIFCGSSGLDSLNASTIYSPNNSIYLLNNYTGLAGYLFGKEVYYDIRLQPNKILVGSDYLEILSHIAQKGRKEKLLKISQL